MKESKIIQTILLAIFVAFVLFLTIRILPVNLTKALQAMVDSTPDTDLEGESALIYFGAVTLSIGMAGIAMYVIAFFILIASFIMVLFAVRNMNSNTKWVRYSNYVLAFCSLFMLVSSIVKMILWRCGY